MAATAPERLAALRADLTPLRPDTADMFGFVRQVMAAPDKQARLDRARRALTLVEGLPHRPSDAAYELAVHNAEQIVAFYEHYSLSEADALVYRDRRAAQNVRWWRDRTGDKIVYWAGYPGASTRASDRRLSEQAKKGCRSHRRPTRQQQCDLEPAGG